MPPNTPCNTLSAPISMKLGTFSVNQGDTHILYTYHGDYKDASLGFGLWAGAIILCVWLRMQANDEMRGQHGIILLARTWDYPLPVR